jgi:hypothetical protein
VYIAKINYRFNHETLLKETVPFLLLLM